MTVPTVLSPVTVATAPPGLAVIVYDVMGEPLTTGTFHDTWADLSPRTATTPVGAVGMPAGVTAADGAEGCEVPIALVALTVKVYEMPLIRPVTVPVVAVPA